MATMHAALEQEIVEHIRLLSPDKQQEVLDFAAFLLSKVRGGEPKNEQADSADVVEQTWGTIPLDRKTAIYIAEDKELEYDI